MVTMLVCSGLPLACNSSGELWRNRMHRVVIHLCSPLLCQTSWLQRQLLKDGIILITIFVGIVSVQHQVLTISLSHGIVTMAELVYRMLVTLLYVSKQWGVKTSLTDSWTYYPIPFTSTVYGILGQQTAARVTAHAYFDDVDLIKFHYKVTQYDTYPTFQTEAAGWFLAYGK